MARKSEYPCYVCGAKLIEGENWDSSHGANICIHCEEVCPECGSKNISISGDPPQAGCDDCGHEYPYISPSELKKLREPTIFELEVEIKLLRQTSRGWRRDYRKIMGILAKPPPELDVWAARANRLEQQLSEMKRKKYADRGCLVTILGIGIVGIIGIGILVWIL